MLLLHISLIRIKYRWVLLQLHEGGALFVGACDIVADVIVTVWLIIAVSYICATRWMGFFGNILYSEYKWNEGKKNRINIINEN